MLCVVYLQVHDFRAVVCSLTGSGGNSAALMTSALRAGKFRMRGVDGITVGQVLYAAAAVAHIAHTAHGHRRTLRATMRRLEKDAKSHKRRVWNLSRAISFIGLH